MQYLNELLDRWYRNFIPKKKKKKRTKQSKYQLNSSIYNIPGDAFRLFSGFYLTEQFGGINSNVLQEVAGALRFTIKHILSKE